MWAKLFERDGKQVLVTNDQDEDGNPCVKISAKPKGLGVSSLSIGFKDTEEGYELCDKCFEKMDEGKAFDLAQQIFDFAEA